MPLLSHPSRTRVWISIAAGCLVVGAFLIFWRGPMPFEGLIRVFARLDESQYGRSLAANQETLRRFYSLSLGTASSFAGLLILGVIVWERLGEGPRNSIYSLTLTLTTSCALMIYLVRMEYEGPWAPVSVLMHEPSSLPIFGHRLLFVWIAKAFQMMVPRLSDLHSFYLSQFVAAFLTMYALGQWSILQIGKTCSWVGQVLGVLMISTCFRYRDFYDVAVVMFATCGLMAIYTRRYWLLVPVVLIGTFNYEGLLLLIPLAAYVAYREDPPKKWIPPVTATLLAYCVVRFSLQAAIPFARQVDWRIWSNMTEPFLWRREMIFSIFALAGWYAVAAMSVRRSDPRLRPLMLLLPLIVAVTILFGQLIEPRQFNAFIPVLVAVILSAARSKFELETRTVSGVVR